LYIELYPNINHNPFSCCERDMLLNKYTTSLNLCGIWDHQWKERVPPSFKYSWGCNNTNYTLVWIYTNICAFNYVSIFEIW